MSAKIKVKTIIKTMNDKMYFNSIKNEYSIGVFENTAYYPENHFHAEYELFYLESGNVTFVINGEEIELKSGNCVFIQPNTYHYLKKVPGNKYHYYAVIFDKDVIGPQGDKLREIFESIRIFKYLNFGPEILKKIETSVESVKTDAFGKDLIIKSVVYDIVTYVLNTRQYVEVGKYCDYAQPKVLTSIESVLEYIKEHYKENITMEDVLALCGYSKSHFIRLFKKNVGMKLTDFINQYRVEKSCIDLIYSKKNVTQIAMENGFNTVQYFSKVFKDYMNCTPKQYQKKSQHAVN